MAAERATDEQRCGKTAVPVLEDLLPIAAVIGAGCEPCAARMVERALERGSSEALIDRTLAVVAAVSSAECLAAAVGAEVVDRMKRALRAGRKALRRRQAPAEDPTCLG